MHMNMEIDPNLARRLDVLLNQPNRNSAKAAQARAAYLDQAQQLANSSFSAVTAEEKRRHIGWMHPLQQLFGFQKKEHSPMFGTLGTILLIVSLVLGGSGVTVAAAQSSLPDQALYPVKTWSEDARVQMSSNTQTRIELALEYSQRRVEEIQVMLRAGQVPPEIVPARMQAEIDLALRLAAGQPDSAAVKALEQIRQQIRTQEQAFTKPEPGAGTQVDAILNQTRTMLRDRLQLCDLGIQDPDKLRQQLRDRDRLQDGTGPKTKTTSNEAGNPWTKTPAWLARTPTPGSSYGPGPGDGAGSTGGAGSIGGSGGNNPWTTGTPTPNSGYGPGPGDGAGSTDGNGGNNPWTTGTPTPGSGYGPGPGDGSGSGTGGNTGGTGSGAGEPNSGGTPGGNSDGGSGSGSGGSGTGGSGTGSGSGAGSGGAGTGGSGGRH